MTGYDGRKASIGIPRKPKESKLKMGDQMGDQKRLDTKKP